MTKKTKNPTIYIVNKHIMRLYAQICIPALEGRKIIRDYLQIHAKSHKRSYDMKNMYKLLGIIALVAIIGFTMVACGDDGPALDPALIGEWFVDEDTTAMAYDFKANGQMGVAGGVDGGNWTWSTSGGQISVAVFGLHTGTATYAISGKELTLSNVGTSGLTAGTYYKE